jgi:SAM-dependent methyltransferase
MIAKTATSSPHGVARDVGAIARWELLTTVMCSGAVVMLVEIIGTRIIGPIFGVSLFVWAALLSVTLCALAVGYYAGGVLIDRAPRVSLLGWVLLVGGIILALVPMLGSTVLRGVAGLGPRTGPLLGAFVLFAPVLTLLGMTGPIALRLATTDISAAGKRVGSVYAVSTAGSLVGTLATSFWLIPTYETQEIVLAGSVMLIGLGVVILARRRRGLSAGALAVPFLASLWPEPELPPNVQVLASKQSLYGLVEVIDSLNRDDSRRDVRFLRADHSVIGAQYRESLTAAFGFLHVLEAVRFLRPAAKEMLIVGLGSGSLPRVLAASGIRSDVVEIDPAVVEFAERYFGFSTPGEVFLEDARTFIRSTDRRYDLIVHDTFTGGSVPEHLLSLEVLREMHELLRPGGVLSLNFVGYQRGPHVEGTWAVARTLRAAFPNVRAFRDRALDKSPDSATNITFFASDGPLDIRIPPDAKFEADNCERVLRSLESWELDLSQIPDGVVITDERNPLGRLQLAASEEHFRDMNELLPLDVWIR